VPAVIAGSVPGETVMGEVGAVMVMVTPTVSCPPPLPEASVNSK